MRLHSLHKQTSDGIKASVYLLIPLKAGARLVEGCQEDQRVIVQTVVTFSDAVCTTRNRIKMSLRNLCVSSGSDQNHKGDGVNTGLGVHGDGVLENNL